MTTLEQLRKAIDEAAKSAAYAFRYAPASAYDAACDSYAKARNALKAYDKESQHEQIR